VPLVGRGRHYSLSRAVVDTVLTRAYAFDWPARLPGRMAVRRVDVALDVAGLDAPLKLGFASDLHAGPTTPQRTLEEAFAILRDFAPDALLLGGDFVLFDARHCERLVPLLCSVPAPLGRYAVPGNHDLWADDRRIARTLARAGVDLLINRTVRLPGRAVSVGGLDDEWTGAPHYEAAFASPAPTHVLLMHSPDHAPQLMPELRFTLALCGHTHGGQVALPSGKPIFMVSELSRRYAHGRFELPGGPMFVSRGVGNVEFPLRAFAAPDVLCVTLRPDTAPVRY
jgi:predicted MPP superfamily phosphohydrolase